MPRIVSAAVLLGVAGCSSAGPSDPATASSEPGALESAADGHQAGAIATGARSNAPKFETFFAEDRGATRATACSAYPQYDPHHIATLLGRSLGERRGGVSEGHDACNLFGEGLRVRFVTSRTESSAAARNQCQMLAGNGAQMALGPASTSWVTASGVYTAHNEQCYLTQVIDRGALDRAASLRVAQDVAWRQM
jgi:hypothetical protein